MEFAIETVDLVKCYGDQVAVNKLNLQVEKGTIHGFLGPNGAGKTTTLKVLMGLLWPDEGSVFLLGNEIQKGNSRVRLRIGYMPELPRFPDNLKAWELLDVYSQMYGVPKDIRRTKIDELLSMVGLEEHKHKRIGAYSKGMRQKLGIAQSLISDPELVILDEPDAGLDPVSRVEIRKLIKQISTEGVTIFLSSHLLEEVEHVCSHVSVIDQGVLLESGPLKTLSQKLRKKVILVELVAIPEKLRSSIEALSVVESCAVTDTSLRITTLSGDVDARREISRCIVSAGGEILSMEEEHITLEEMFLDLVSKREKSREVIQ